MWMTCVCGLYQADWPTTYCQSHKRLTSCQGQESHRLFVHLRWNLTVPSAAPPFRPSPTEPDCTLSTAPLSSSYTLLDRFPDIPIASFALSHILGPATISPGITLDCGRPPQCQRASHDAHAGKRHRRAGHHGVEVQERAHASGMPMILYMHV